MNSKWQSGFSLVESLIVLMVTSLIFLLSSTTANHQSNNIELRYFVNHFLTELEKAQNYAVIQNKAVKVEIVTISGNTTIQFFTASPDYHFKKERLVLPTGVRVDRDQSFWVKGDTGYIQPTTIYFSNSQNAYKITIQMGMGRYRVEEIKR